MSTRFKRLMSHVLNVLGFLGIRIHWGNKPEDTEGCILVGHRTKQKDWVSGSREKFEALFSKMMAALAHKEEITLTISGESHA